MNEKQRTVFSLLVDYVQDLEDLARLRIAISDNNDTCLYYGWVKFLKNTLTPLVWKHFSYVYFDEKNYLLELVKDTCRRALDKMQSEMRFNPYETLLAALEDCKNHTSSYVVKAKGPEPINDAYDSEDWEDFDDYHEYYSWREREREEESYLKRYDDWIDADQDIRDRWVVVLNDTIDTLKCGKITMKDYLELRAGRRIILSRKLKKNGLQLRADSFLCREYIKHKSGNISEIVKIMAEMKFLHEKTDYRSRVALKSRSASIEPIKLVAAKHFIENNPDRIQEVPHTLIEKVNTKYETNY